MKGYAGVCAAQAALPETVPVARAGSFAPAFAPNSGNRASADRSSSISDPAFSSSRRLKMLPAPPSIHRAASRHQRCVTMPPAVAVSRPAPAG